MSEAGGKSSKSGDGAKKSSQGPLTMWHGLDLPRLVQFLAMRPPMGLPKAGQIATLPAFAAYNSFWKGVEKLTYGRKVAAAEIHPEPVFIVGHWRSGTTYLHNLMCQDTQFGFPNLYQCLFPHHFLVTEAWAAPATAWTLPESRPMDNVPCGWDLPQEDEIALCLLSLCSPYRMMAVPEDSKKFKRFFDPETMSDDERAQWGATITQFMKKLSVRHVDSVGRSKPLCMKSPSHTFRVGELAGMFPKARFLYIHRDPYAVYSSTGHLRRTMWRENGLTGRPASDTAMDPLDDYVDTIAAYERDKEKVAVGRLHEVAYDDLAARPLETVEGFYTATQLDGFDALRTTLEPQLASAKEYKRNRFELDPATKQRIYERARFVFDRYGYDPQLAAEAVSV